MGAGFGNVFRPAPLWPRCFAQTCFGRMKNCWNWPRTLPGACLYRTTRVVGFGALAWMMCATRPTEAAVAPFLYLIEMLIVHAASAAVSGLPSLHLACGCVLNVHVLPWFEERHERAKNGANLRWLL